ncbi:MAG: secretin and TonB N-terminal domain-containing protein [Candidatus Brocadia sp.]|jgi:type II secretory pathway component GspD/PulD (secretin)
MSSESFIKKYTIIVIYFSVVLFFTGCAHQVKKTDTKEDNTENERRIAELKKLYQKGFYNEVIMKADKLKKSKNPEVRRKANFYLFSARRAQLLEEKTLVERQGEISREKMLLDIGKAAQLPKEKPKRSREEIEEIPGLGESISSEYTDMPPEMEKKLLQKVGTINLIDADLDFLIFEIFKSTGVNILADTALLQGKKITIRVREETIEDILNYLSDQYNLEYRVKGNTIYLTMPKETVELETRVYRLNKGLNESRLVRDFVALSDLSFVQSLSMVNSGGAAGTSGGMGMGIGTGMGMGFGMDTGMGMFGGSGAGRVGGGSKISEVSGELGKKASIEVVLENIDKLVDWPRGSTVLLDRKKNVVFIRTTAKVHREIAALIKELDKDPVQIVIESRFLEVSRLEDFDFGFNFKVHETSGTFFNIPFSAPPQTTGGSTIVLSGVLDQFDFQAVLFLLDRSENVTTISSPKVTTTNNSQATIAVAKNVPFVENYEVVTSGVSDVNPSAAGNVIVSQPALKAIINDQNFEGIALNVTPSVGADGRTISLVIQPVVRSIVDEKVIQNAALIEDVTVPSIVRPIIESRIVNTQLTIEDGNTVVLGGQITAKSSFTRQQTPFLGDIPILGNLFKRKTTKNEKRNLLIFVTAHILSPTGQGYID